MAMLSMLHEGPALGQIPPTDHAIYKKPAVLERVLAPLDPGDAYLGGSPRSLKWTWKPDREKYFVGEPLSGTLTVSNPSANRRERLTFAYEISPPANGTFVSTLAVWRGPAEGGWDTLRPVARVNHGSVRILRGAQGRPVVIRPGESLRFPVALNSGPRDKWHYARGFEETGKSRVFLRYQNLEPLLPFSKNPRAADRDDTAGEGPKEIVLRPTDPVVIGPVGVDIVRLPVLLSATLHPLMPDADDGQHEGGHVHGEGPLTIEEARQLLAVDSLRDEQLSRIRQAAVIESLYARARESRDIEDRLGELTDILESLRRSRQELHFSGADERLALLECMVLEELGRGKEALRDAERLLGRAEFQMPQLAVFVELAPERAERRRLRDAAPVGGDDGTPISFKMSAVDGHLGQPLRVRVSCRNHSTDKTIDVRPLSVRSAGVAKRTVLLSMRRVTNPESAFVPIEVPVPQVASTMWGSGAFSGRMPPGRQYSLSVNLMYDWSNPDDPRLLFESTGEYEVVAEYQPMSDLETDALRSRVVRIDVSAPTVPEWKADWERFRAIERGWLAFAPERLLANAGGLESVVDELRRLRSEGDGDPAIRRAVDATVDFADYLAARDSGDEEQLVRIGARLNKESGSTFSHDRAVVDPATRVSQIVRADVGSRSALLELKRLATKRDGQVKTVSADSRPGVARKGEWTPPAAPPSWFGREIGNAIVGPFSLQDLGRQLESSFNHGREGNRLIRFHGVDDRGVLHHARRGYAAATFLRGVPQGATEVSTQPSSLRAVPVAAGVVAVLVNHEVAVEKLTIGQLKAAFSGNARRWDELVPGMEELEIEVYTPVHGTYAAEVFRDLVLQGEAFTTATTNRSAVAERQMPTEERLVTSVGETPGAIGFLLGTTDVGFPPAVNVIPIAADDEKFAILPDRTTVQAGSYPLAQPLFLVVPPEVDTTTADFVSFMSASWAESLLERSGLHPLEVTVEQPVLWIPANSLRDPTPLPSSDVAGSPSPSQHVAPTPSIPIAASNDAAQTANPGLFEFAVLGVALIICWFAVAKSRESRARRRQRRTSR